MKNLLINVLCSCVFVVAINLFFASKEPLRNLGYGAAILLSIALLAGLFFYLRYFLPLRKASSGFPYVLVEADGSVRELNDAEKGYLNTDFFPSDSGRPYIKNRYDQKRFDGSIKGFIYRDRVPTRIQISPLPQASD